MVQRHLEQPNLSRNSLADLDSSAIEEPSALLKLEAVDRQPGISFPRLPFPTPRWLLVQLGICISLGGLATLAFFWLTAPPPPPNCKNITLLSADIERLSCAQTAAKSGKLADVLAGLKLVEHWTPDHPLYSQSRGWIEEWSHATLAAAQQKIRQSDLAGALNLARQIPPSSPVHKEAQTAIAQWQHQWQSSQKFYDTALAAIRQQDWDKAYDQIRILKETSFDHWRTQKAGELAQRINQEKRARQVLAQAQALAASQQPEQVSQAIDRLGQIRRDSYAWADIQPQLNQWGEILLKAGLQQWQARNLEGAIAFAKRSLVASKTTEEAQNLIRLSEARKLAIATDTNWQITPQHFWNLMGAINTVAQIPSDSRFHEIAQFSLASWKAQLQDITQLQLAQLIAASGNHQALQFAVNQAQQIDFQRPRRMQAQTLIAYWRHEMERLEDGPILEVARKLAAPGTVPDLRQAIAMANRIPEGRFLRGEAQGLAYDWRRRIEVIEDQPYLNMARLLASEGDWSGAIKSAALIRSGRALYWQAQAGISDWRGEIQKIEQARKAAEEAEKQAKLQQEQAKRDAELPKPTEGNGVNLEQQIVPDTYQSPTATELLPIAPETPPAQGTSPTPRVETPAANKNAAPHTVISQPVQDLPPAVKELHDAAPKPVSP
jgi:hypothetical protein